VLKKELLLKLLLKKRGYTKDPFAVKKSTAKAKVKENVESETGTTDKVVDDAINLHDTLFNTVSKKPDAIAAAINNWIEEYNNNRNEAIVSLINFILQSCGCNILVSTEQYETEENEHILEEIVVNYKDSSQSDNYPIISNKKRN